MRSVVIALLLHALATAAYGEIYTWKDKRGTEFFTNSLYEIPERYRSRAKLLDVPSGKRLPIGSAPAAPSGGQPAGQPLATPAAVPPSPNQPGGSPAPAYQPAPAGAPVNGAPPSAATAAPRPPIPGQRVPRRSGRRPVPVQPPGEGE